jgi:hypothetical protein
VSQSIRFIYKSLGINPRIYYILGVIGLIGFCVGIINMIF